MRVCCLDRHTTDSRTICDRQNFKDENFVSDDSLFFQIFAKIQSEFINTKEEAMQPSPDPLVGKPSWLKAKEGGGGKKEKRKTTPMLPPA